MDYFLIKEAIENRANLNIKCPKWECNGYYLHADIKSNIEVWVCADCHTSFNKEYLIAIFNNQISDYKLTTEKSTCAIQPKEKKAKNMNKSMMKKIMMMNMMGQGNGGMANNLLPLMMMNDGGSDGSDDNDDKSSMMMLMMMQANSQPNANGASDQSSIMPLIMMMNDDDSLDIEFMMMTAMMPNMTENERQSLSEGNKSAAVKSYISRRMSPGLIPTQFSNPDKKDKSDDAKVTKSP